MAIFRVFLTVVIAFGAVYAGAPAPARAQLEVDITKFNVEPIPIAIPAFEATTQVPEMTAQTRETAANLANVVIADLERSGLFRALPSDSFIEQDPSPNRQPRFGDWRAINAQGLVVGQVEFLRDGRLQITFRLWDVFAQAQMAGVRFQTTPGNWRQIAHRIADAIYERLTGEKGYFDTRIVYIAEEGIATERRERLAVMDQDGANHEYLTDGNFLVLSPRFSPSAQEITFMSYEQAKPQVYLYNLDTGKRELLEDQSLSDYNMTFAPRFSPDGDEVIMSLERGGNSDIYIMDLKTRRMRQAIEHPDIDTAPSFAPDGRRFVFESDRSGTSQLYVASADGSSAERISFGNGTYRTPVWSPRGDLIAFTYFEKGRFSIGVMRPDGAQERLLTEDYYVAAPTWSPNGRVIMYTRRGREDSQGRGGGSSIWSIDLTGRNERRVPTPGNASDPAWSPLIE